MFIVQSDNGVNVLPQYDAKLYRAALTDGVLDGCAVSASGINVIVDTGALIACGRVVIIDSPQVILATSSGSGYIKMTLDIDSASTPVTISLTSSSTVVREDINNSGTKYELIIGTYTSNGSTASATKTLAVAVPNAPRIRYGTATPSSSLGNNGDIYIQY